MENRISQIHRFPTSPPNKLRFFYLLFSDKRNSLMINSSGLLQQFELICLALVAQITTCTLSLLHTSLKLLFLQRSARLFPLICLVFILKLSSICSGAPLFLETISWTIICISQLAELLNIIVDGDYGTFKFEKPGINECSLIFKMTRVIPFRIASSVTINPKDIRNDATVF